MTAGQNCGKKPLHCWMLTVEVSAHITEKSIATHALYCSSFVKVFELRAKYQNSVVLFREYFKQEMSLFERNTVACHTNPIHLMNGVCARAQEKQKIVTFPM